MISYNVLRFDLTVSRSGRHRNRGVFSCSQSYQVLHLAKALADVHSDVERSSIHVINSTIFNVSTNSVMI